MVLAKFKVTEVTQYEHPEWGRVKLRAVMDDGIPENQRFAKATPDGQIEITINNPPAFEQFTPGKNFYVQFTAVD